MAASIALITGASSGIGAEFARQLAPECSDLVLVARRRERLDALAGDLEKEFQVRPHVIAKDLSREGASAEVFAETGKRGLEIDWLINNAGFGTCGPFAELPLDRELEEIGLNISNLVALCHLYLPGMTSRGRGHIVNLGSVGSFVPVPYMATYGATKAFVLSFSEALATAVAKKGVRVLALCPGATRTEFQEVAGVSDHVPEMSYMSADDVVRLAIAAARQGKRALVPGIMNKASAGAARFLPRSVAAGISGAMFQPKGT